MDLLEHIYRPCAAGTTLPISLRLPPGTPRLQVAFTYLSRRLHLTSCDSRLYIRLLNTRTLRFVWVTDPDQVDYAILSHVWSVHGEQSFEDVDSVISPTSNRHISEKIRRCCAYALAEGYEFVWIDSCCINQTSSAELSEAINSMYKWYQSACQCYAYLHDVDDSDRPYERTSQFRSSVWFTRGWTLQELIAPSAVVFLTRNWKPIGTKDALAGVVEEITGISTNILRGLQSPDAVSVARRMSWASRRKTTRVEDEAYCLMGLFGIHMPTIYGEGSHAFVRLQEAILRQLPDDTLFSWGKRLPLLRDEASDLDGIRSHPDYYGRLFAPSPRQFEDGSELWPIPHEELMARLEMVDDSPQTPSTYSITRLGVQAELPILSFHRLRYQQLPDSSTSQLAQVFSEGHIRLGFLLCMDSLGNHIALILRPPSEHTSTPTVGSAPSDPLLVGSRGFDPDRRFPGNYRLAAISDDVLSSLLSCGDLAVTSTHIPPGEPLIRLDPRWDSVFHPYTHAGKCNVVMPSWRMATLEGRGVRIFKLVMDRPPAASPWCPRRHVFVLAHGDTAVRIVVGFCEYCRPSSVTRPRTAGAARAPLSCIDHLRVQVQSCSLDPGGTLPETTPESLWFAPHDWFSRLGSDHVAKWVSRKEGGAVYMEYKMGAAEPDMQNVVRVSITAPESPRDLVLTLDVSTYQVRDCKGKQRAVTCLL